MSTRERRLAFTGWFCSSRPGHGCPTLPAVSRSLPVRAAPCPGGTGPPVATGATGCTDTGGAPGARPHGAGRSTRPSRTPTRRCT